MDLSDVRNHLLKFYYYKGFVYLPPDRMEEGVGVVSTYLDKHAEVSIFC